MVNQSNDRIVQSNTESDNAKILREQYKDTENLKARAEMFSARERAEFWRSIFDLYEILPEQDVLEVGAGYGQFWVENADRLSPPPRLTLSDLSPGMVEAARENLDKVRVKAHCCTADACDLPFADRSFDRVFSHFMLYHVPSLSTALSEFNRVLRDKGELGVLLPEVVATESQPAHVGIAFELAPHVRAEFEATSKPKIGPADVVDGLSNSMVVVRTRKFESTKVVSSPEILEASLRSLPVFSGSKMPDEFWREYRDRLKSYISEHGGVKIDGCTVANVFQRL